MRSAHDALYWSISPELNGPGANELINNYRAEVLAEAADLIEAERAADEALHPDEPARINRRVGMRQAMTIVRRMYEPGPEPSRRPRVRRSAADGKDTGGAAQAPAGESTQAGPDLFSIVLAALSGGQGPVLPLPAHTVRILTARVTDAVAPLVYRPVWDSSLPPGGESTRVWQVFEEDAPRVGPHEDLYATEIAAERAVIARYEALEGVCPDYSWRPHDDGSRELLAGGEPVGIYLASVAVKGEAADAAPDFFQPGRTYTDPAPVNDWAFRCDTVTTRPNTGERTALGWRRFHGQWEPYSYEEGDWEIHQIAGIAETTEGGEPRG